MNKQESADKISKMLWSPERNSEFLNGDEYAQHDQQDVVDFENALADALDEEYPNDKVGTRLRAGETYFAGRFLDDSDSPFYKAYMRFYCIDGKLREWGQHYFVNNPNEDAKKLMRSDAVL